jgi:hypothetical protein
MSLKSIFLTKLRNKPITTSDIKEIIYPDLLTLQALSDSSTTWTEYANTSTIVGWSGSPSKFINYIKIGKLLLINYSISGTSNATTTSFTIPFVAANTQTFSVTITEDNQVFQDYPGYARILTGTSKIDFFLTPNSFNWTASGVKKIQGHIMMQIN